MSFATLTRRSSLRSTPRGLPRDRRGAVLLVAMLFSLLLAIGLLAYLRLSRTALQFSSRTYFANDARNLAELGLEEALYCFKQMNSGVSSSTAWSGWTCSGATASRSLPALDRDQNGMARIKVFVDGYDGSAAIPTIYSQATITPFDGGPPVVKLLRLTLKKGGYFRYGIVGLQGIDLKGHPSANSFQSNPTGNTHGPFTPYTSAGARSNAPVVVSGGSATLGSQAHINGNLNLSPGVTPPSASQVSGNIYSNFSGSFTLPTYPTAASVSQSYNLGGSIPATLPVAGHLPASDGNYYYFTDGATLTTTTISSGKNVILVGTHTSVGAGLTIQSGASLRVFIDGTVNASGNGAINNNGWAGALQIFTSTTGNCSIGGNGTIYACLYAPNASLTCNGGGSSGMLVGSFLAKTIGSNGHMDFHYDETLLNLADKLWMGNSWFELQSAADKASIGGLTNNFLP